MPTVWKYREWQYIGLCGARRLHTFAPTFTCSWRCFARLRPNRFIKTRLKKFHYNLKKQKQKKHHDCEGSYATQLPTELSTLDARQIKGNHRLLFHRPSARSLPSPLPHSSSGPSWTCPHVAPSVSWALPGFIGSYTATGRTNRHLHSLWPPIPATPAPGRGPPGQFRVHIGE